MAQDERTHRISAEIRLHHGVRKMTRLIFKEMLHCLGKTQHLLKLHGRSDTFGVKTSAVTARRESSIVSMRLFCGVGFFSFHLAFERFLKLSTVGPFQKQILEKNIHRKGISILRTVHILLSRIHLQVRLDHALPSTTPHDG